MVIIIIVNLLFASKCNDKVLFVDTETNFSATYFLKCVKKTIKKTKKNEYDIPENLFLDSLFYYRITTQLEMADFLENEFLNLIKKENVIYVLKIYK